MLTSPVNGQLNCTESTDNTRYRCEGRCNQGYYFYEDYSPSLDVFVTECTIGGNWTHTYIPACVSSLPTSFKQVHELVYQPVGNESVLTSSCLTQYITTLQQTYSSVSAMVTDVCGFLGEVSRVIITGGQFTDIVNNSFTGMYTLEFDPPTVEASHDCVQATAWIFTKTTSVIEDLTDINGITGCANLTAGYQTLVTNEQMCDDNVKTRDQSGTRVCLVCPPGTFKTDNNSCELCPLGAYNDREGMSSCSSCPLGTWTETEGSFNSSDCKGVCRNGLYSSTRLPPCTQCPDNSYPVSSHSCQACPAGTKYIGTAAYRNTNCLTEPCQFTSTSAMVDGVGGQTYTGTISQCEQYCEELEVKTTVRCTSFSYNTLLQECILHHGDIVRLEVNSTFDHYSRTCYRLSDSECYCVLPCLAGNRSFDGFQPCTECPKNYYTDRNQSTDCEECPPNTMTLGTGATSNSSCVDAEQMLCPRCRNGATCRIIQHDYVCACPMGYQGRDCDQVLDPCLSRPCYHGATCTTSQGTFTCTCPVGTTGDTCEVDLDDCGMEPCLNGGICVDGLNSFTCVCLHPYYGNNCELDNSTDICVSVPCENGGSCTSVNNLRRKCVCPPGFKGQDCEINVDECASSPCLNGGLCVDGDNAYTCTCPLYQGERCETPRITCDSLTCGNADECYYDYRTGLPQCICNPGYILEPGQSDCSLVDLCASSPCMNGGTCSNVPAGIICHCPLGYGGSLCQHDLDDCVSLPCANNGTCVDGFNNFTCLCLSGYSSDDCSSDVNECLDYPCNSTGTQSCNNTYGGFICQCNPGYSGSYCSVYTDRDPCGSNPCLHGGVCGGLGNDFTCDCRNGWTGQQCETLVNYCNDIDNPCRNAARCVSLQDDFFCRCENGSYGRYCDDLPDLCSRLDPCLNHATCTADREMYTGCSCTAGFFGTGCKLTESQDCSSSPCLNGGTCSMDPSGDILCACVHGYDGNICQHDVNECENATCPGQGTCVDGINRYFCRCPQGKLPPDCLDVSTLDYDLCFDSSLGEASAFLPFGIPLNEQFMTIRFWVKFSSKSGTGTFFSMFEQTDPDPLSGRALLFSLDQDGLHTSEEDIHPFGSYTINNGEWHLVVITWDTTEGKVEVRANTVRVIYLTDYQRNRLFSQFYWVTLGNEIPLTSMTSVPGGRFQGCISQVNIFGRILETNGQLPRTMSNTFSADSLGDVLQWVEFELLGLVNRIRPSTRLDPSCTSCSVRDKSTLNITCPGDIYLESANLYSSVTWSLPQHDEYLPLTTNMLSGTVLPPGKHTVMYSAADINNNTAVCSFRVFIRDNKCELPDLVGDVTGTCQSDGIDNRYTGCSLSCPTPHKILSRATPLYTCGPLGWWDIVAADRTCSPITPTCGNITSTARVNLNVRLVYPAALTICNLVKNSLETYIREHIRSLDQHWDRKLCVEETCQDIIISINCTSPSPTVEFVISNITMNITSVNGDSKSPEEMFIDALLDQNRFHFEELIPNTNPVIDQSTVESVSNCPDGYLLVNSECVTCGLGMYLNTTTLLCEYCPKGFYYNSDYENNSCRACPEGTTTECPAAVSVSQCHAICQNGSFFNITSGICELCPLGTYQNESGQFQCLSCQYGQTTHQNGTTDVNSCFDMCASGHEISEEGSCRKCEVGSYRGESDGPLCILCPAGITTPKNGSETVLNCTIVICSPGHRANDNNTHCERCPIGEFQPRWNQISCLPCPENTTTEMEATVNETMCETFCASGYERLNETCEACPIGQYKDNSDGLLGRCVTCSSGYVTPNIASTSSSNCSLYNCTEGSKINANNSGCELCPNGEYQPEKYQTDCLPCPNGTSTLQPGATQCEVFCPSGQQLAGGVCEPCPIGYYKNNTEGLFEDCKPCPVEFITAAEGATNEDLCVIGNCTSGQYLVNTTLTCTACPTGTYQPEVWQTECIKCPPDTTTQQEGTTQRSQCFLFCDAGNQGRNMTCEPCPVGYYKSVAGASPCSVCPPGNRTKSIGSTDISDCNIGACDPGTFLNENTCELCPYGQYQSDPWQDDCLSCPSQTTTYKLGAALVSDCIMACAGGFEYNTSSGQCEMCDRGFYRDNTDPTQAQCQPCPIGTITAIGQISNSILFCFMANCTVPGEYRDSIENTCRPCPRGQYQDRKWQDSCQKCPDNYTTFTEGATSTTQCRLACIPGYHEDNGTCAPCPHGTYRQSGQWCQNCSDNWTTHSNAATDVNQCVPNCTSGQYYSEVNRECALCPPGTYQAEPYQTNCTECVPGTTTRTGGATTSDSCWSLCHNLIHNCSEHAQCQMIGTNATCTCRVGYIGDGYICQHRCNTAYCLNGGTCVWDIDQSIGCQCHLKYTGDKCQFRQAADSIGPQTWTVVVGSVVGGVTFLAIFIIVSVLIGVTYRRYLKNKAMTPKKSLANGTKSKQFATRANLGNYGGGPPFHSPEEKTNNFKWSSTDGKIADTKYINMDYDSNSDEAVYQPPSEQP
ncbi:uncharacterized protein [Argopecten irradians]|uniref:uncharacterized protein n=1 Tax=Argopecten irradians TaxID=31199 RepID=UPI003722AE8C